MKGQNGDKRESVIKFIEVIVGLFSYKNLSQIPCEFLLHSVLSLIT